MSQQTAEQQWIIRRLNIEDLAAVHALECLSFSSPWSLDAYRAELTENPLARYYGCCRDGQLLAFAGLWQILDEGHVCNVAVHPAWRGQGLGELLMRHLIAVCQSLGSRAMTLEVRESNAVALNLYQKLGFYEAGRRPHYYTDNDETALILWLDFTTTQ